jgi:hypothetical protein
MEDKTEAFGYDPSKVSFFVGDCEINRKNALGKHCIIYCNSPDDDDTEVEGCQFAFKLKSWSRIR